METNLKAKIAGQEKVWLGLSYGSLAVKWGPYRGEEVGPVIEKLLEVDPDRKIPFFISVELPPPDDLFAEIADWSRPDDDAQADQPEGEN